MRPVITAARDHGPLSPIDVLIDVSGSDSIFARSNEEIVTTMKRAAALRSHIRRVAIVSGSRPAAFGISRMGESHANVRGLVARVFRTRAEAEAWLRRDEALDPAEADAPSPLRTT